jgi:2-oxoacid:acceptor oxidoreductase gamma subunit (pyruvate/2-ketoisovalerate family)
LIFGFYGRSGQGVEKAVRLFAKACFMSGLYVQSFTFRSHDRRGSPVTGYVKTDKEAILSKSVENPDFYIVFDSAMMDPKSLKDNSTLILNVPQKPISEALRKKKVKIYSVDATSIALLTKTGAPNTAMIGALTKLFSKVSMKSIRTAMDEEHLARENVNALEEGYRNVR